MQVRVLLRALDTGRVHHALLAEADRREAHRELLHLLAELGHARRLARVEGGLKVRELLALDARVELDRELDAAIDEARYLLEVRLTQATRGERRRAHPDAAGNEGALVTGHRVLVERDRGPLEHRLDTCTVDAHRLQVHKQQVVVRPARDDRVAELAERIGERGRVAEDLLLILLELRRGRLLKGDRERRDRVVVRAALVPREHRRVDRPLQVVHDLLALLADGAHALAVEDHRAARATERFVRGGGHHVGVLKRTGHHARRHEPGDVRHVRHEVAADRVSDLPHARVVDVARVRRCARNEHLGPDDARRLLERVVVDQARRLVQLVREGLKVDRHRAHLLRGRLEAVAQMAAVRQVEAHQAVVRVHEGGEDAEVRGRARQRLHVHTPLLRVEPERLECALPAQALRSVDPLVATIVACAGVAFGVLVLHNRAESLEHGGRRVVLRRDQRERCALAALLLLNHVIHLRVKRLQVLIKQV
mmetsp:Transcript_19009/g.49023  ORF Transcript_19009/g.49023 Transcript_19009/m.49023 type:complete len:480 (+) Transcript_19009:255-1694(+)